MLRPSSPRSALKWRLYLKSSSDERWLSATTMMLPPSPPSSPEGPPYGTPSSRRNAAEPLPPSPALTAMLASSMNRMGTGLPRGRRRYIPGRDLAGRVEPHRDRAGDAACDAGLDRGWHHGGGDLRRDGDASSRSDPARAACAGGRGCAGGDVVAAVRTDGTIARARRCDAISAVASACAVATARARGRGDRGVAAAVAGALARRRAGARIRARSRVHAVHRGARAEARARAACRVAIVGRTRARAPSRVHARAPLALERRGALCWWASAARGWCL